MILSILPKLAAPCVLILSVFVATVFNPSVSRGQEKNELSDELRLSYEAFDQYPGSGWRKIADTGKYREAARLIIRSLPSATRQPVAHLQMRQTGLDRI